MRRGAKQGVPHRGTASGTVGLGAKVIGPEQSAAARRAETGQRLRDARLATGLTQQDLAKRLGKSERTIRGWEAGQYSSQSLELLSRELGVPISRFYGDVAPRSSLVTQGKLKGPRSDLAIQFEKLVVDALAERGIATDASAVLLPFASLLLNRCIDAVARVVEATVIASASPYSPDKLDDALRGLEIELNRFEPDEDAASAGPEHARVYRALYHRARHGDSIHRPRTILRGLDAMNAQQREATAAEILQEMPLAAVIRIVFSAVDRTGHAAFYSKLADEVRSHTKTDGSTGNRRTRRS